MEAEPDSSSLKKIDFMLQYALDAIQHETRVSVPDGMPTSRKDKGTSISITKIPNDPVSHLYIVGDALGNPEIITMMGKIASLNNQCNPKDDGLQYAAEEEYSDTVVFLGLTDPVRQRSNLQTIKRFLESKCEHESNVYGVASLSDARLLRDIEISDSIAQDSNSSVKKMITCPILKLTDLANALYHDVDKEGSVSEDQLVNRVEYVMAALQNMPDAIRWKNIMMLPYHTLKKYEKNIKAHHIPLVENPLYETDQAHGTGLIVTTSYNTEKPVKYNKKEGLVEIAPGAVLRLRLKYEQIPDSPRSLDTTYTKLCNIRAKGFASVYKLRDEEEDDTAHAPDTGDEKAGQMTVKGTEAVKQVTVPFE